MRFTVVTLFPDFFASVLASSLLGRAMRSGLVTVDFINPRDFTADRHRSVDDTPYGGGPGMVMCPEPLIAAIDSASVGGTYRVLLTPAGEPLDQTRVRALATRSHLILVCGRYEGIDERVAEIAIDESISIGDFVLSGGEIAAAAVIETVARLIPGVLGTAASTAEESFSFGLLEYPHYTRPAALGERRVPGVLLGGNHEEIRRWRREQSLKRTARRRPDLLRRFYSADSPIAAAAARTHAVLCHYPVYDKNRNVVTSAITNLDLHDIARSTATYGLAGYWIVTPVALQREKVERILSVWKEEGMRGAADQRVLALRTVTAVPDIGAALTGIQASKQDTQRPLVVATSADERRAPELPRASFEDLWRAMMEEPDRPVALLFGTGWGFTEQQLGEADLVLAPIRGYTNFNHVSVRSAAGIVMDRMFGYHGPAEPEC
jgi:tRNA (guanine37-N1)-methyltransferase